MTTIELDPDFSEFIRSLTDHEVQYLIVGGYALAAHGLPRATGDLDVWLRTDDENARRIVAALMDFGFGGLGITAEDFGAPDRVVQLGYPPYRIDLLTSIDGVSFDDAWTQRRVIDVGGATLLVIGREDLIANKRATDRPQDRADVAALTAVEDPEAPD